jgi:hypothetical protein
MEFPEAADMKPLKGEFALWRNLPTIVSVSKSEFLSKNMF